MVVAKFVAHSLANLGFKVKNVYLTEDMTVEDDSVELEGGISVQVSSYGDSYMTVSYWEDEETMISYPERLSITEIAGDIKKAMTTLALNGKL